MFFVQLIMFGVIRIIYCKRNNTGLIAIIIKNECNESFIRIEYNENLCYPFFFLHIFMLSFAFTHKPVKTYIIVSYSFNYTFCNIGAERIWRRVILILLFRPFRYHFCFLFVSHVMKQNSSLLFRQLISSQLPYANDNK